MTTSPQNPVLHHNEISADWLADVLAEQHGVSNARLIKVDQRSIGTGQVGENVRFSLQWDTNDDALPASVVGKFPSSDPTSRAAAAATRTYEKEIGFYRDLQESVAVRTPKLFYLAEDLAENDFTLVMEDISPSEVGDQIRGCGVETARVVVGAAADLHASTWGKGDAFEQLSWIDSPTPEMLEGRVGLYRATFGGFVDRYANRLSSPVIKNGEWLADNLEQVLTGHKLDRCLVHGDFRLDNMLFGDGQVAPPVTVVDWQTATSGYGPVDLAYFLGAGLLAPDRQSHEADLFALYQQSLEARGVAVDSESLWHSYRLGSTAGFIMAVIASQIVGQTERGDDMFVAMASRHSAQMLDLKVKDCVN